MALVDVSANPLNVVVDLYPAVLNAGAAQNAQYVHTVESLINAPLQLLPAALQTQFAPILPILQNPMGNLLNTAWAGLQSSVQNYMAAQFESAASGTTNVTNVSCSLPPSGTVLADDFEGATSGGVTPNSLEIDFHLPGGSFNFTTPYDITVWPWPKVTETLYPAWNVNFDADLALFTLVPKQPFNLTPSAAATLSNANGPNPANAVAFGLNILDNFLVGLGNFFTAGNYISEIGWIQQQVEQQADQTQPVANKVIAPMLTLFNTLNSAGPECVALGFTQCAFSIANPSTLTLTITHPLDPGPTIEDANNPPGIFLNNATIAATAPEATPGSTITAYGTNFPVDTTTSLNLEFPNTSSGTPTGAQVQFNGQIYNVPAPAASSTNEPAPYTFNPTGLVQGNTYVFQARCGDQATWSQWGQPFPLATTSASVADLVLSPVAGGQVSPLGSAPLPPANTTWTCPGNISPNTPAGQYFLQAQLGGTVIAETSLSIVTTLKPQLAIIDPTTGASADYPRIGGTPFTLGGYGLPDGPVTINFNGTQVATTTASNGGFNIALTTPGGPATAETLNVTATDGAVTATLTPPINLQGFQ